MKMLQNLNEAKILSKKEQLSIKGGKLRCTDHEYGAPTCPPGYVCVGSGCELLGPEM